MYHTQESKNIKQELQIPNEEVEDFNFDNRTQKEKKNVINMNDSKSNRVKSPVTNSSGVWTAALDALLIGACPHSWLFKMVAAVVHHGGAGMWRVIFFYLALSYFLIPSWLSLSSLSLLSFIFLSFILSFPSLSHKTQFLSSLSTSFLLPTQCFFTIKHLILFSSPNIT